MARGPRHSFMTTKAAKDLCHKKQIKDLENLRADSTPLTYVVLNCEGQEGCGCNGWVTSIGVAFLQAAFGSQPPEKSSFGTWPWTNINLDDAVRCYNIRALSIAIEGRHRNKASEHFRYGKVGTFSPPALEDYLYQHLHVKQQRQGRLVLVAWCINNELEAMASFFP